ncbi:hypothetical protein B0T16DRAFT_386912 [Cercophora newfieldiana]|uniref:Septation initiation network scaffold protein cdc11 n=1 Tax=Cercophora newfieldiana TaxID=92897 RepID=A0AA39YGI5_9PEZI|nr:hypothetical protein B0T16DRAFT_386912 [Cercophora newfieldiana]
MGHAWLDSLSEDWVSQHGSDASIAGPAAASAPAHDAPTPSKTDRDAAAASRIPRLNHGPSKPQTAVNGNSSGVLSERSVNEIFTSITRRTPSKTPSKLSQEIKISQRGRYASRSVSASTSGSVVHNTVHKSQSASPGKRRGETPEWKRRLIYGDLSYGEQPDLFTSAATGLENMFKPPPAVPDVPNDESYEDSVVQHEVTLPSSPPVYERDPSTVEIHVDESVQELPGSLDRRGHPSMRYRRTEDSLENSLDSEPSVARESCSQGGSTTEQTAFSAHQPDRVAHDSRKVSGRSDVRYEDFSPILLERRQASNGKETFGPADLPPDELRKRLEKLRQNQMVLARDFEASGTQGNAANNTDYEQLGMFVNFRRGGRSADGSFRHRVLSSGINDTSELNPEESLQASTPKQFPTVRMETFEESGRFSAVSPDLPRPPNPSPHKRQVQGSSGSPLKLFQPYDTFTNQTLLRRLSQFQGSAENGSRLEAVREIEDYSAEFDQGEFADLAARSRAQQAWEEEEELNQQHSAASYNQFGTGKFDGYEFQDEYSYQSNDASGLDGDKENHGPEDDSVQHPRIFDVSHDSSPSEDVEELLVQRKRGKSNASASTATSRRSSRAEAETKRELHAPFPNMAPNMADVVSTPRRKDRASEIKRPRTSPSKDPTPKRRRTLHKSDVAYGVEGHPQAIDSVQVSHQQMQSIIGRKRKDALHGDPIELADADVLASREMLRPRTPTPTQRSSLQRDRPPLAEIEKSPARSTRKPLPVPPHLHGASLDSDRKPSIKTEDFINEANKIMAMIRSKAGIASGLASLEESDAENMQQQPQSADSSYQESTQEPFSRPPSREGRAPLTRMSTRQEDPELVQRLKKYEEPSDMGDIIGSSIRSVALAQEALRSARERADGRTNTMRSNGSGPFLMDDDDVISDPPNIRISQNPNWQSVDGPNSGVPTHASSNSSHSTGRSIPTGSSRGSENRKVIAPESVLHLIPDQVGNMVLDRQRNIWIKRKPGSAPPKKSRSNYLPSEASEDDPFADIPDLTVDMTMEMQNLRLLTAQKQAAAPDAPLRAATPPTASKPAKLNSLRMSRLEEEFNQSPEESINQANETLNDDYEEVEHEITINEDRVDTRKRRNLTISFSSPIASVIQDLPEGADSAGNEDEVSEQMEESFSRDSMKRGRKVSSGQKTVSNDSSRSRSRSQRPARHLSVRGKTFVARPVSRIDEREEESILDRIKNQNQATNMELSIVAENSMVSREADPGPGRQTSLSFVVTTPARPRDCAVAGVDAAPIISQYVGTLSLSPLSEFTVHHGEETMPLEASYVVGDHRLVTGDHSKRVMSMNTRELVGKLAEVEPFEPYWEDMRELELRDKRLESLHALNEFCASLEKLDVSSNGIRNLNGIPGTVRHLKMTDNQLSSLTDWGHLMNLQYVDVSNNGLTSISAFKNLVHLRSLRVDNNQITSLDGIKFHDGLQSLRARGNAIEELDFNGNTLDCLTDLDLKNNKIHRITNLEQLPALDSLNLEGNELEDFAIAGELPLSSLRYLRLDDNKLSSLDIKLLPHLRLLHADRNHLTQISGFSRARRIDSLSLREQRGDEPLNLPSLLSRAYEVRKLFLSGNFIGAFEPPVDLLNLQLLELANCGLQALPADLGFMLPNLRTINLNMNALSDLAPLAGVPRLKRILVSGNRVTNAAGLVEVIAGFTHLREVDVRDNPVTQGFYAPVQVVVRRGEQAAEGASNEPFSLPDQDGERDEAYCGRLDMDTRMRRRLYEQMVAGGCDRVRKLDGLALRVGKGHERRDSVWRALRERGLISPAPVAAGEEEKSKQWPAEDSFA